MLSAIQQSTKFWPISRSVHVAYAEDFVRDYLRYINLVKELIWTFYN